MPRTYKKKGVHTSPENAGAKNLVGVDLPKDEGGLMNKIMPIYKQGEINRGIYGGQWTDEEFAKCVGEFFDYCYNIEFKPTVPGLQLWLGVSKAQFYDWRTKPEKYGVKSEIINTAMQTMELYLQGNIDSYPTGSIFLLKSTHGHTDSKQIEVKASTGVTQNEVNEAIERLGLKKDS